MKDYGVDVQEDISVIGFDETPTMERRGITTICTEPTKMSNTVWNQRVLCFLTKNEGVIDTA